MKASFRSTLLKTVAVVTVSTFAFGVQAEQNKSDEDNDHQNFHIHQKKNEALVVQFYDKVFNQRLNVQTVALEYLDENYIQHNPYVPTGRQGFIDAIGGFLPYIPDTKYDLTQVISDGDLVILHVHAHSVSDGALGSAIVDIFRVEHGKIVEHWDVQQQIPAQSANSNSMF